MTEFDRPIFANPDPKASEIELQAKYTELTGKSLFPAQPETLLSNWAAYLKTLVETQIQLTGEQSLINYATGVNLDQLGAFWDAPRLSPQKALTTIRFTLANAQGTDYVVPQGTRVRTEDRQFLFTTQENLVIPAGEVLGDVGAIATVEGESANGYGVGTINQLFDLLPNIASVSNLTVSNAGQDTENDQRYRERLKLAPNKLSTAGSRDSYKFWALTADSSIIDVAVRSLDERQRLPRQIEVAEEGVTAILESLDDLGYLTTSPEDIDLNLLYPVLIKYVQIPRFYVEVFPLVADGIPSVEVLEKVAETLDDNTIRPLTDTVVVLAPTQIDFEIKVEITAFSDGDVAGLISRLSAIMDEYKNEVRSQLGRDIVPSQIIERLQLPSVYQVNLLEPSQVIEVNANEFANCTEVDIELVGVTAG